MDLSSLQCISLEAASAKSEGPVLQCMVRGLAKEPGVVLARVWLVRDGDICSDCAMREHCPDRTRCLHLVASAGTSTVDPSVSWRHTEGRFRRMPLAVRKVGQIGARGEGLRLETDDKSWAADPAWMEAEGVRCFAGQPLMFRDEVLGVVALFSQRCLDDSEFGWLRTFADQAAVAIANARAFEELEGLRSHLELERDYLREELQEAQLFSGIIGTSPAMQNAMHQVEMVAQSDASVLITGESGTGKELVATAIHEASERRDMPMVRVNCAATPADLFESEFFGHLKGSFTGAVADRAGRFQVADGGTLFLDEVGEIPLFLQSKLLRVLQEGQFSRVGEDKVRTVDVRIIAATNRDLKDRVAEGKFREDLYYRLAVFPIEIPPLRDRLEDVPLLARHFIEQSAKTRNAGRVRLRQQDVRMLQSHAWPGNVRELQNVIERALITQQGGVLRFDLPVGGETVATSVATDANGEEPTFWTEAEMREKERRNTMAVLEHADWRVSGADGAAELLGVKPSTLSSRMKKLGIKKPR